MNSYVRQDEQGHLIMADAFAQELLELGVTSDIIDALMSMLFNVPKTSTVGWTYAEALGRAFSEYGLDGVTSQVGYILLYLTGWQGEEAREAKKILRRWIYSI
jgi:hypothetical protein